MTPDEEPSAIICLVRDLLFYSKIRAAAEAANVPIKFFRDPPKLVSATGIGLIVDLNQDGCLQAACDWRARTHRPVTGFVSHVDTEVIQQARAVGIDQVLARSQFEKNLPAILDRMKSG